MNLMKNVFLHIYDFLSKRRWLAAAILAVVLGLCAFSAMRMGYEEDISAFLPQDEESARYSEIYAKLGGQDRIAVFFRLFFLSFLFQVILKDYSRNFASLFFYFGIYFFHRYHYLYYYFPYFLLLLSQNIFL